MAWLGLARQGAARPGKAGHGNTRQGSYTIRSRRGTAWRGGAGLGEARNF